MPSTRDFEIVLLHPSLYSEVFKSETETIINLRVEIYTEIFEMETNEWQDFNILDTLIGSFPSSQSPKFKVHMDWLQSLPGSRKFGIGREIAEDCPPIPEITKTYKILNQISAYFLHDGNIQLDQNVVINQRNTNNDSIYYSALRQNELEKDGRYQLLFTRKPKNVNSVLRGKVVEWIIAACAHFNYAVDTVYISTFLIDAFLHEKTIKTTCWPLLGLTAFHLAGKMEEKNRAGLSSIWKKYKNLAKFSRSEVQWMEQEVLRTVKFNVNPATPKLFADLAFNSGCITFPCAESERIIKHLSYEILLSSLQSYEMSSIRSFCKADLAMLIATEYVMYHHNIYLKPKNQQTIGELEIMRNAVKICYSLFRIIFSQRNYSSSSSSDSSPDSQNSSEFRGF